MSTNLDITTDYNAVSYAQGSIRPFQSEFIQTYPSVEIFKNELNRLQSFDTLNPIRADKRELALFGFYSIGVNVCRCYFCNVEIGDWQSCDNVLIEHLYYSPNCPLLRWRITDNEQIHLNRLQNYLPPVEFDNSSIKIFTEIARSFILKIQNKKDEQQIRSRMAELLALRALRGSNYRSSDVSSSSSSSSSASTLTPPPPTHDTQLPNYDMNFLNKCYQITKEEVRLDAILRIIKSALQNSSSSQHLTCTDPAFSLANINLTVYNKIILNKVIAAARYRKQHQSDGTPAELLVNIHEFNQKLLKYPNYLRSTPEQPANMFRGVEQFLSVRFNGSATSSVSFRRLNNNIPTLLSDDELDNVNNDDDDDVNDLNDDRDEDFSDDDNDAYDDAENIPSPSAIIRHIIAANSIIENDDEIEIVEDDNDEDDDDENSNASDFGEEMNDDFDNGMDRDSDSIDVYPIGRDQYNIPVEYRGRALRFSDNFIHESNAVSNGPKFVKYILETERRLSFKNWPRSMPQKPVQLAEAGFFYEDKGDRCTCYCCGGTLGQWEMHDLPWQQHALYFPECDFLKMMKGDDYINNITLNTSEDEAEAAANVVAMIPKIKQDDCDSDDMTGTAGSKCIQDEKLCKICYENEYNTVFLPCGHIVACAKCSMSVQKCPTCRKGFTQISRVYFQ